MLWISLGWKILLIYTDCYNESENVSFTFKNQPQNLMHIDWKIFSSIVCSWKTHHPHHQGLMTIS